MGTVHNLWGPRLGKMQFVFLVLKTTYYDVSGANDGITTSVKRIYLPEFQMGNHPFVFVLHKYSLDSLSLYKQCLIGIFKT